MKIVFATNNLNKIKEVQSLVPSHITLVSLEAIGCHEEIPCRNNYNSSKQVPMGLVKKHVDRLAIEGSLYFI
jgi:inosine/xanthosine triphosphate pyrophosphatase family protein